MSERALLLDTCALIWIANNEQIGAQAFEAVRAAENDGFIYVCPFSAWEIGTLVARGRLRLTMSAEAWFERIVAPPAVRMASLTSTILTRSTSLPGTPPADPAGRIILSTARELGVPVMTRDRRILDYAAEGWVRALPC